MESKYLKIIQVVSKIGKVLSTIVFVCCIIGAVGCLIGILSISLMPNSLVISGMQFSEFLQKNAGINVGTVYASIIGAIIVCAGNAVISKMAQNYFKHELEAGTPFTDDGAKEMFKLAIFNISISLGSAVIIAIVSAIMKNNFADYVKPDFSNASSIGMGLVFLLVSLLCHYGAELNKKTQTGEVQEEIKTEE